MFKISHILAGALAAAGLMAADWATAAPLSLSHNAYAYSRSDQMGPVDEETQQGYEAPAQFKRQVVAYSGSEAPGTIIIDTPNTFLYLVQPGGRAIRYGIGVGRDGFRWSGTQTITKKAEWPDWTPPAEMIQRQPYLPRFMAGGATNPLGARAMYLGNTVYRIHGTNAPSTIGQRVSSGCIRLTNEDVIDLASRVNIGTKVVVINHDYRVEQPGRPMMSAPASMRLR
ncbi:MAG: L,D-transpeptidase [Alphaproteobacteria bacterium]|nr:MAG: L,D-transpeptidase [Alphaproteobacteria bacterium]